MVTVDSRKSELYELLISESVTLAQVSGAATVWRLRGGEFINAGVFARMLFSFQLHTNRPGLDVHSGRAPGATIAAGKK